MRVSAAPRIQRRPSFGHGPFSTPMEEDWGSTFWGHAQSCTLGAPAPLKLNFYSIPLAFNFPSLLNPEKSPAVHDIPRTHSPEARQGLLALHMTLQGQGSTTGLRNPGHKGICGSWLAQCGEGYTYCTGSPGPGQGQGRESPPLTRWDPQQVLTTGAPTQQAHCRDTLSYPGRGPLLVTSDSCTPELRGLVLTTPPSFSRGTFVEAASAFAQSGLFK